VKISINSDQTVSVDFEPTPVPSGAITFSGSIIGAVVDEGHGGCNGGTGGTAPVTGSVMMTLALLSLGGYSCTGTVIFNQGTGICHNYSGSYGSSSYVSSLN
jgi:hypothetical protein